MKPAESIVIHPGTRVRLRCALRAPAVGQWLKARQCTAEDCAVLIPCSGPAHEDTGTAVIIALRDMGEGAYMEAEVLFQVGLVSEHHIEMVRDPEPDDILPGPDTRDQDVMSAVYLLIGDSRRSHTLLQHSIGSTGPEVVRHLKGIPGVPEVKIATSVSGRMSKPGCLMLRIDHAPPESVPTEDRRQLMIRAVEALMEAIERLPPDPLPARLAEMVEMERRAREGKT